MSRRALRPERNVPACEERWRGVNQAGPGLNAFLDAELARHSLGASRLALVGFSQGTMMALHVGLRRQLAPAAILGYSGILIGPEHLRQATARTSDGASSIPRTLSWGSEPATAGRNEEMR